MTSRRALIVGHCLITLPVVTFLVSAITMARRAASPYSTMSFPLGFVVAWLYWSIAAPRWRRWALSNVVDAHPNELLSRAASTGLLWRTGSVFERTELRPRDYQRTLATAQLLGALRRLQLEVAAAENDDWGANAFEEVQKHICPLIDNLEQSPIGTSTVRSLDALGAQLQVAINAGLMQMSDPLEEAAEQAHEALLVARSSWSENDSAEVAT